MPLVRLEVRNEYRLGDARLYEGPLKKDDSKAILGSVAVAGLVGLLRQLGDLTEFAADVFQDLHEQVITTAARGRKISTRIQNIEFALPFVEKAVKGQTSHIHFAYVSGSQWHARPQDKKSHLTASELPCFMIESYEECREPPRLYQLDKFDHEGTGACLKRYSDPSYFRRAWTSSKMEKPESLQREKKVQKFKRRGSQPRNESFQSAVYMSCKNNSRSSRFASPSTDGHRTSDDDESVDDRGVNSELSSRSPSFGSRTMELAVDANNSVLPSALEYNEVMDSEIQNNHIGANTSVLNGKSKEKELGVDAKQDSPLGQSITRSYTITWDEKTEIDAPRNPVLCNFSLGNVVQDSESLQVVSEPQNRNHSETLNQADILMDTGNIRVLVHGDKYADEGTSEADNYLDARNTLESDADTEVECQTKWEVNISSQEKQPGTIRIHDRTAADHSSDIGLPNASHGSLNGVASSMFPSGSSDYMHPPQMTADYSLKQGYSDEKKSLENNINVNIEGKCNQVNGNCISLESDAADSKIVTANVNRSRTSVPEHSSRGSTSSAASIKLWSNGVLFGVEPSKPLFLGVIHNSSVDLVSVPTNSRPNLPKYILKTQKHESPTNSAAIASFSPSGSRVSGTAEKSSAQPLPSTVCDMDQNQDHSIGTNISSVNPLKATTIGVVHGAPLSAGNNTRPQFHRHSQSTKSISSGFSELAQRFLANSLQRKGSIINSDSSAPAEDKKKSEEISCVALDCHKKEPSEVASQAFFERGTEDKVASVALNSHFSEQVASVALKSHLSEQSSPPLEEMKISLQPMKGLETSKLKLEVLNGSLPKNNEDSIFPSFQLLQGSVDPYLHRGPESDDDTFGRSCSYSSEDLLSPRSYSNSEMWEKDNISVCKDHELWDSPKIPLSSDTSIYSHMEFEQTNHSNMNAANGLCNYGIGNEVISQDAVTSKLRAPDSAISLRNLQGTHDSSSHDPTNFELQTNNHRPLPPPLPPMKWRAAPQTSREYGVSGIGDNTNHLNGLQAPQISSSQQQGPNSSRQCIYDPLTPHSDKQPQDQPKLNRQSNSKHGVGNKEADIMEELLCHIRNKEVSKSMICSTQDALIQSEMHEIIKNKSSSTGYSNEPHLNCCNLGRGNHNSLGTLDTSESGDDDN